MPDSILKTLLCVLASVSLAACGGGGSDNDSTPTGGSSSGGGSSNQPVVTSLVVTGTNGVASDTATANISPNENDGAFSIDFSTNQDDGSIYRVEFFLSADNALDEEDIQVIAVNCNTGFGQQACTDTAHWNCTRLSDENKFDCEQVVDEAEYNFTAFFNEHGQSINAYLFAEACVYDFDPSAGASEVCGERSVEVFIE